MWLPGNPRYQGDIDHSAVKFSHEVQEKYDAQRTKWLRHGRQGKEPQMMRIFLHMAYRQRLIATFPALVRLVVQQGLRLTGLGMKESHWNENSTDCPYAMHLQEIVAFNSCELADTAIPIADAFYQQHERRPPELPYSEMHNGQ
ncbi:hypothetical protein MMC09_005496, partial [Bachmanniomyces sp. S44760]|nr:hypothetical protein [Bachmanniomyces sp. S44760]